MKIHTLDTTDPDEIALVRGFIITHKTNEGFPSFHRCEYNDGSVTLFYGFDLDSEIVASASKGYAYVCSSVLKGFKRFCEERQSPLKITL